MRNPCAWIAAAPRDPGLSDALLTRGRAAGGLIILASLGFAGCAQQPQQIAAAHHSKEYFPSSVYGRASRRVIESGPIPHGGGQYLVGKPYTVAGHTYYPTERKLVQVGYASWYGDAFHGRLTANGEIYDRDSFTAAHPTMPLPSYARVTNLRNHYSMIVRVNDRGPFASDRIMDVSRRVAEALQFQRTGTAKIKVEYVAPASLAGSDDAKLYATLRTDGPAEWREPTMVAAAPAPTRFASTEPMAPAARPVAESALREDSGEHRPRMAAERVAPEPVPREARIHEPPIRSRAILREEPRPNDRPTRVASREEPRPTLRWQSGPMPDEAAIRALLKRTAAEPPHSSRALRVEPEPPLRPQRAASARGLAPLPPSRHLDLATIPGAGVPISAGHHAKPRLRLSRND